jgi:hypothetical protein
VGNWTIRVFSTVKKHSPIRFLNWYLTVFGEDGEPLPDSTKPTSIIGAPTATITTIPKATTTPTPSVDVPKNRTTTLPDKIQNLVGGNGALAFFAISGFLGVIAFTYYICYHRKKTGSNRDDLYSFKELEDEADVFGGEYEGLLSG